MYWHVLRLLCKGTYETVHRRRVLAAAATAQQELTVSEFVECMYHCSEASGVIRY